MQSKPNLINSHNEWDKLREVIVGTAEGTMPTLTWNKPGEVPKDVKDKAFAITPVPGGVGPMTIAMVLQNTLDLYKAQLYRDDSFHLI